MRARNTTDSKGVLLITQENCDTMLFYETALKGAGFIVDTVYKRKEAINKLLLLMTDKHSFGSIIVDLGAPFVSDLIYIYHWVIEQPHIKDKVIFLCDHYIHDKEELSKMTKIKMIIYKSNKTDEFLKTVKNSLHYECE